MLGLVVCKNFFTSSVPSFGSIRECVVKCTFSAPFPATWTSSGVSHPSPPRMGDLMPASRNYFTMVAASSGPAAMYSISGFAFWPFSFVICAEKSLSPVW